MINNEKKYKKKAWFRGLNNLLKIFLSKKEFVYLGQPITEGAIVLSNHVGTGAPLSWTMYNKNLPVRLWGAHEMNEGLISAYKYLSKTYYHQKKGWNLGLARVFCIIAAPLTNMFYKGLNLISTYRDSRFKKTIEESLETLKDGCNVVIFTENSEDGYKDELVGFHKGFLTLAKRALAKGLDCPIFVSYFRRKDKKYVVDAPIMASKLLEEEKDLDVIAQRLCDRCNELGKMELEETKTTK